MYNLVFKFGILLTLLSISSVIGLSILDRILRPYKCSLCEKELDNLPSLHKVRQEKDNESKT